jgi:hypothetical protein
MTTITVKSLDELLEGSAATDSFKNAIRQFEQSGQASPQIQSNPMSPSVKVLRMVMYLLDQEPELAVDAVEVEGHAGCSDFVGKMGVKTSDGDERTYQFKWDCKWRSDQEGWKDFLGFSDQARAAREYGYQCVETWNRIDS